MHFNKQILYLNSHNFNFDIIILETWLLSYFNLNIQRYQTINSKGTLNKSNGITILTKENIKISCIDTTLL